MGVLIPSIPYKSQLDQDAGQFRNDCGPASLAMILHAFGHKVTTDAVYRKTGAKADGYVSVTQLMKVGKSFDVPFQYFSGWSTDTLKAHIKEGRPVIALVHYHEFVKVQPGVSTQYRFTGPHFITVVGYDKETVMVNDPLWSGSRRKEGEHRRWTNAQFFAAWNANHKDGNRNRSGIISVRQLKIDAWGSDAYLVEPPYKLDPVTQRRLNAWAAYLKVPLPQLTSQAVADAYVNAMGNWGLRVTMHQVQPGDSLGLLALHYYDDPLKWNVISAFNGMSVGKPVADYEMLIIPEPLAIPVAIPHSGKPAGGTSNFVAPLSIDRDFL